MESSGYKRELDWRYELKYRLNRFQYLRMRAAILPYMRPDYYSLSAPGGKYLVRSLYFDTRDYASFHQKMSGDDYRVKYRIRAYSRSLAGASAIRVELKVRKTNAMIKYGTFIKPEEYFHFRRRRHWPEGGNPVLDEFERCFHLQALQPQILIEYLREGFEDRVKSGLRITFDHRVGSAHSAALFPEFPVFFRAHHPHGIVLEIKGRRNPPDWLRKLVREQGLKLAANSKYTQGILAVRQDLYHPGGVVVIR